MSTRAFELIAFGFAGAVVGFVGFWIGVHFK